MTLAEHADLPSEPIAFADLAEFSPDATGGGAK
jgi:hypothetical protein